MTRTALGAVVLIVATACADRLVAKEPATADAMLVRLERTGCYGTCPIYAIEITRTGVLRYRGDRFVKTKGTATGHVAAAQLGELRAAFARAGFDALSATCCDCHDVTDMPGATITLVDGGTSKTIRDYHGCLAAPKAIRTLEDDVDRIVAIETLIGTPEERRACCTREP